MKIAIASDSFKGSLSSKRVCFAIQRGLKKSFPEANTVVIPVSDGGEGSIEALNESLKYNLKYFKAVNPIGKKIKAKYLIGSDYAIIEMAQASGITLIKNQERNPFLTTSYGTGELILDAIKNGYKKIYLCVGGSATIDGGAGLLQALGIKFFDFENNLIDKYMNNNLLSQVTYLDQTEFIKNTQGLKIILLSDVKNKLLGKNGSVYTYGLQKGAKKEDLPLLENNIKSFYRLVSKNDQNLKDVSKNEASGAAGGVGGAIQHFFDCETKSGIGTILKLINFSEKICGSDIIITGEGSIDNQTLKGKVISGIIGNSDKIPVIALTGSINDKNILTKLGVKAAFSICNRPMDINEAMANAESLVENLSMQIGNLLKLSFKSE